MERPKSNKSFFLKYNNDSINTRKILNFEVYDNSPESNIPVTGQLELGVNILQEPFETLTFQSVSQLYPVRNIATPGHIQPRARWNKNNESNWFRKNETYEQS